MVEKEWRRKNERVRKEEKKWKTKNERASMAE